MLLLMILAAGGAEPPDVVTNSLGMRLVYVPPGSFAMGSPADEPGHRVNERPVHEVEISQGFYMAAHEVTVGQFRAFVEATGHVTDAERDAGGGFGLDFGTGRVIQDPGCDWRAPGFPQHEQTDEHPVVLISWQDAEAFCRWLSQREGVEYRLPTEAEWEYACRAGTRGAHWPTSTLAGAANVADQSLQRVMDAETVRFAPFDDGHAFTAPVGSYAPNPLGLHDMHGNVWEWCRDWYDASYYARSPREDPGGPAAGSFRAIRGGGWLNGPAQNRSAQRIYFAPTFRYCLLSGFRVVREAPHDTSPAHAAERWERPDMKSMRWKRRLLVLFAPGPDSPALERQRQAVRDHHAALDERDVSVITVVGAEATIDGRPLSRDDTRRIRDRFDPGPDGLTVVLVGKDGTAKRRWTDAVDPGLVVEVIDAMPMRQHEMQQTTARLRSRTESGVSSP